MSQTTNEHDSNKVNRQIARASYLLIASVLLSRIIGFFREWILAKTVGATQLTDVYYASFTIPDFLNYLMAAGALSISFIPVLSQYLTQGKQAEGNRIFRAVATYMGLSLVLGIVIAEIFAEKLAIATAPGFNEDQITMLTFLIRIILPAQFFFYWGGLAIAVQQSHGKFWTAALAPIIYNSAIIAFGLAMNEEYGVAGFSVGVMVGSILGHGLLQMWGLKRLGYDIGFLFRLDPEIKAAFRRYLWLTFPVMLGFSIVVTDEWISKYYASFLESRTVSWLSYARTEMRIPIAIIGQAAGIASFPYLSKLWFSSRYTEFGNLIIRELQKIWALAPIAAVILFFEALPITHFIFGGSKFTEADRVATAFILQKFSVGVFFWIVQIPLSRAFYACQKTWLPSILGTVISVLCFPLYAWLTKFYNYSGLALAGSIGIAIYSASLAVLLRAHLLKKIPDMSFRPLYRFAGWWSLFLVSCGAIAYLFSNLKIYQVTRLSAFLEVCALSAVLGVLAYGLQRRVFATLTKGPLF